MQRRGARLFTLTDPTNTGLTSTDSTVVPIAEAKQSKIYIIGTGGTIAGSGASATDTQYKSAQVKIDDLIAHIPALRDINKRLKSKDLFQIDSSDITVANWLELANTINDKLAKDHIHGVVVTHGTDTIEETAYFLHLVIKSAKPVVLVGAMRPSTALSSDGAMNLYNALAVANSPDAVGKGVLVVMNDTIFDARDVTKNNTTEVNALAAPNSGPLGKVHCGKVQFSHLPVRKHTMDTPFNVGGLTELPVVEIVYEHAGQSGNVLKSVIATKPGGIVIAGTGDGNVPLRDKLLLQNARRQNIEIVRCSRTGSGYVTEDGVDHLDTNIGLIGGDNLSPQKARILLMLSIAKSTPTEDIKNNFRKF